MPASLVVCCKLSRAFSCSWQQCVNSKVAVQGTLIGSKVYLFGGEDAARRPQGDLFVLDLADKEWLALQTTGVQLLLINMQTVHYPHTLCT